MHFNRLQKVDKIEDVRYPSGYKNNTLDVYVPTGNEKANGILIWLHGGGFVAGDKDALEEFATYVAAENRKAVVTVNYEHAPESGFPNQVLQLDDACQFLMANQSELFDADFSKILFGGDSAGGQIAGQYVVLQTNREYAREFKTKSIFSP